MKPFRSSGSRLGFRAVASAVVVVGALVASVTPALAAPNSPDAVTSEFIAYSQSNFTGTATIIDGCGGHNMPYPVGSYEWINRGQSARLYNLANEQGTTVAQLAADTAASSSTGVGWKSIFIVC